MPIYVLVSALVALVSCVSAEERGFTTAIFATPIHEAQVVRADDGMDHVEYELLLVNVFASPVTLSSLAVFDTSGQGLTRIEGNTLLAATQTLLAQTKGTTIPASAAASVDVDLALPPGTAPDRVTHRIAYSLDHDAQFASIIGSFSTDGPDVAVNRTRAIAIQPPLSGKGWWAANGCCAPSIPRDIRIAIDGLRIETPETFAIDWTQVKDGGIFQGDGASNKQHYAFGADILAVGDGTVVSIRNDMPEEVPSKPPGAVKAPVTTPAITSYLSLDRTCMPPTPPCSRAAFP